MHKNPESIGSHDELTELRIKLREKEAYLELTLGRLINKIDPATGNDLSSDHGFNDTESNVVPLFGRRKDD